MPSLPLNVLDDKYECQIDRDHDDIDKVLQEKKTSACYCCCCY